MTLLAEILPAVMDRLTIPVERMPIRNREPRERMDARKWHLIWERDGGHCWMCGRDVPKGTGEIDHVVPRSSFLAADLEVADRSDNLKTACVSCNQAKSNYETVFANCVVGITLACWDCLEPSPDPDADYEAYALWLEAHPRPLMTVPAYCAGCGMTHVPNAGWLL